MMLSVENLEAAYGESQVLFGLSFEVREGEVATLLGRNGMGKTTTVRAILGLTPARAGRVSFRGRRIERETPDRIARAGMAVVPEGRQIFPNLSVEEHLLAFHRKGPWSPARVFEMFPNLKERREHYGNQLSGGEQQMLAIGRALVTNPHLLILDEATEGLAPLVREEIWRCLGRLREAGQTIVVIDKYVERLVALADLATIDRTTLTRTIDRMEQAGWLARRADAADMRVTRLELSAAGRRMFERIWPEVERLNNLALAGLSAAEIESLRKILGRMRANLEDYVRGETHAA